MLTFQHHHALAGAHRATGLDAHLADNTVARRQQRDLHLHCLDNHQHVALLYRIARLELHLPQIAGNRALYRLLPGLQRLVIRRRACLLLAVEVRLTAGDPALALGVKGRLLVRTKCLNAPTFAL